LLELQTDNAQLPPRSGENNDSAAVTKAADTAPSGIPQVISNEAVRQVFVRFSQYASHCSFASRRWMTHSSDLRSPIYPLLLLLFWGALALPSLGLAPLFDYDETVYAQTALDMMHHGQWIVPTANGMAFFDKPPITYYLMDLSFKVFGANAFAARLPSVIFTMLTAWVLFAAGARLHGRRFGLAAAAIFLSTLEVALLAHAAILDAVLNFFIAASLLSYAIWVREGSPGMAYAMAAAMGAAVSVKGCRWGWSCRDRAPCRGAPRR
jgi:hypothetical protein